MCGEVDFLPEGNLAVFHLLLTWSALDFRSVVRKFHSNLDVPSCAAQAVMCHGRTQAGGGLPLDGPSGDIAHTKYCLWFSWLKVITMDCVT